MWILWFACKKYRLSLSKKSIYTPGKPRAASAVYHQMSKLRIFGRGGCTKIYSDFLEIFWFRGKGADTAPLPRKYRLWLVCTTLICTLIGWFAAASANFIAIWPTRLRHTIRCKVASPAVLPFNWADSAPCPRNRNPIEMLFYNCQIVECMCRLTKRVPELFQSSQPG